MAIIISSKGSVFSGNWRHAGRLGKVGGSAPKAAAAPVATAPDPGPATVQAKYHSLESMPSYQSYLRHETPINESGMEDLYLKSILHDQGFDGKPDVRTKADIDAFVQQGETELFRGVTVRYEGGAEPIRGKFTNQFRDGELFVGRGISGNGTYTAHNGDMAREYAGPEGDVMRMTLKKDAKVIGDSEIYNMRNKVREDLDRAFDPVMDRYQAGKMGKEEFVMALESHYADVTKLTQSPMWNDPGRVAAVLGYDAIRVGLGDVYIILNRTAVRVQDKDLEPGK